MKYRILTAAICVSLSTNAAAVVAPLAQNSAEVEKTANAINQSPNSWKSELQTLMKRPEIHPSIADELTKLNRRSLNADKSNGCIKTQNAAQLTKDLKELSDWAKNSDVSSPPTLKPVVCNITSSKISGFNLQNLRLAPPLSGTISQDGTQITIRNSSDYMRAIKSGPSKSTIYKKR